MNNFASSYKQLNKEQKSAVDQIDGPVMVVAGPGTGKTQTIALRIANILKKTDTDPDSILALTFTESGARAMRERLFSLIGTPAYYVNISTFHGFCNQVIADSPGDFVIDPDSEPLSELEKLRIIHRLLDQGKFSLLRSVNAPYLYSRAIIRAISDLKRESTRPDKLKELLDIEEAFLASDEASELKKAESKSRNKHLNKNRELLTIYQKYEKEIFATKRFDFEDMINHVTFAFRENNDLLADYQERHQYFLVDEYQDTNNSQNELVSLLASHWGQDANVFVVGDPDQCIMRFQGASIENQLGFIHSYPKAPVITLQKNYRSTQTILNVADSLISHNTMRINDVVKGINPHLTSNIGKGDKLSLAKLSTGVAETIFIAKDIKKKLKAGVEAGEISVIYRKNKDSRALSEIFAKFGIDYLVQGGANILEDPTVYNLIKIFRVVHEMRNKQEDDDLFTILHYDIFEVDPLDVLKLSRYAHEHKLTLFDIIASPDMLSELNLLSENKLEEVLTNLADWNKYDSVSTFTATFEQILNNSGYLDWLLKQSDSHHRLSRINTLFEEVKKMNRFNHQLDLKGFLDNLDLMELNNLRIMEDTFGLSKDAVTLTTAHKSKGLEWDHVYIYSAVDRNWGNNRVSNLIKLPDTLVKNVDLSKVKKNEDERRLFYVASTRARHTLTISQADSYSAGGTTRQSTPSMFISELGDASLNLIDTTQIEELAHHHIESILRTTPDTNLAKDEKTFLTPIVEKFVLSPTSLNSYLECAYKFKLDKLFRVPHVKKPHLALGTAVHKALEEFYKKFMDESVEPDLNYLLSEFTLAIDSEVMLKKDRKIWHEQGVNILTAYHKHYVRSFTLPISLEKNSYVNLEDIKLSGKIDRIEWSSQKDKLARVIDYKTGHAKTMGQIKGTTKDSRGDLKRQLVFYKLLIDLDPRLLYKFGQAMLDFVQEPMENNKDGHRILPVTDDDVKELVDDIKTTTKNIRALNFPRTKDYSICKKCDFKDHCHPDGIPSN